MVPDFLEYLPIIGIFRGISRDASLRAAQAAVHSGITALEVTMNSEEPTALIGAIRQEVEGVTVGAGTVLSLQDVDVALRSGAQFIVCPHLDEEIVHYCADRSVPVFPGATTPTDVWRAHHAGATMVKLFPASSLGADYVRSLRGPFPQIDLLVTGGIDSGNLAEFIRAGAAGAGVGGRLFPRAALERGDVAGVEQEAERLAAAYREAAAARA